MGVELLNLMVFLSDVKLASQVHISKVIDLKILISREMEMMK